MSEMCPSSSHQLVAAALAFHRAREKFPQNSTNSRPQSSANKDKTIGDINGVALMNEITSKYDNTSLRPSILGRGCLCRRNCKFIDYEHLRDKEKSNNHRSDIGDSIVLGTPTLENVNEKIADDKKPPEEFKNAGFHVEPHSINPIKMINIPRSSPTRSKRRLTNKKSSFHDDSMNLLHNISNDNGDNDGLLASKLHEWKDRTHEASLMKMQRFLPSQVSPLKCDLLFNEMNKYNNNSNHSHKSRYYKFNHNHHYDDSKSTIQSLDLLARTKKILKYEKKLNDKCDYNKSPSEVLCQRCKLTRYSQRAREEDTDDTEDDEWVKGLGLIKHKDSLDILVEKFKNRKILGKKNEAFERPRNRWGRRVGIDEEKSLSCEKILDQVMLDEAIKECFTCEDHETCCTRENFFESSRGKRRVADKLCRCYRQKGPGSRLI